MISRRKIFLVSIFLSLAFVFSCCFSLLGVVVTFDANGGKFADDKSTYFIKTDGKAVIELPDNPTRESYEFIGCLFTNYIFTNIVIYGII